jgi:hypothetical protein
MKVKVIGIIFLIIIFIVIGSYFVRDMFSDYGNLLELQNQRTLVSPGTLQHFASIDRGLIIAYRRTGQAVISHFNNSGVKQWEKILPSNRQLIDTSYNYIMVGEEHSREINIFTTDGSETVSWKAVGEPIFCSVSNDARNFVVSETKLGQTDWEILLELRDHEGKELFSESYKNQEVVNVKWSPLGVVVLAFSFDRDEPGQYLYFYDNYGRILYQRRFEEQIRDFDISPSGNHLLWASKDEIGLYNILLDSISTFDINNVVGAGFSSENRIFYINNTVSYLPPEKQVTLTEISFSGQRIGRLRYKGELKNYHMLRDNTLLVATDSGVYMSKNLVSLSYFNTSNIERAYVDSDYIIYVLKPDNTIEWYK